MPSSATITSTDFTSFVTRTLIRSDKVNSNFSIYRGHIIPVEPLTSTANDSSYDLGASNYRWRNVYSNVNAMTPQSTPASNPTAGQYKVYMKSDGYMYKLDSSGVESRASQTAPELTAKGDLLVYSSATGAPARLSIGSDDQVLIADSSAPAGVRWATQSSSKTLNTYTAKTVGTTYLATTDGFVVFEARGVTNTSLVLRWDGITDATTVPTVVRTRCHLTGHANANYANGAGTGLMMPVRSGEYYLVSATQVVGSLTAATTSMWWVPHA